MTARSKGSKQRDFHKFVRPLVCAWVIQKLEEERRTERYDDLARLFPELAGLCASECSRIADTMVAASRTFRRLVSFVFLVFLAAIVGFVVVHRSGVSIAMGVLGYVLLWYSCGWVECQWLAKIAKDQKE